MIGRAERTLIQRINQAVLDNRDWWNQHMFHTPSSHDWFGFAHIIMIGGNVRQAYPNDDRIFGTVKHFLGFSDYTATAWCNCLNTLQELTYFTKLVADRDIPDYVAPAHLPFLVDRDDFPMERIFQIANQDEDMNSLKSIIGRQNLPQTLIPILKRSQFSEIALEAAKFH